jgi:hypothetical protein
MALLSVLSARPDAAIQEVLNATIRAAEQEWSLPFQGEYPTSGIGIAELRPRMVGISGDAWQSTAFGTSWADWINTTVSQNAYIVVTGLFNLTADPQVTEIWPKANGNDLPRVNIEQMYTFLEPKAFFPKPFAVKSSGNLSIQAIARVAATERLGLMGYAVAKRAYLIASTPS